MADLVMHHGDSRVGKEATEDPNQLHLIADPQANERPCLIGDKMHS